MLVLKPEGQGLFKFCITLQCHERWLPCTFLAQILYTLVTRSPLKCKFFRFLSARVKFVKFLMSILKRQVNSSSVFVPFFIVIIHNSSVNFNLIYFLLWTKKSYQSPNFDTCECSGENFLNSLCYFPYHKSVFLQILHNSSCHER